MPVTEHPSIAIWIDTDTQQVKCDFLAQHLSPAEYGVVLATLIVHISRQFCQSNPQSTEEVILSDVLKGIKVGLEQRNDIVLPAKAH